MIILLHSSKTMKAPPVDGDCNQWPQLLDKAEELGAYLRKLNAKQLAKIMQLSTALAAKTEQRLEAWNTAPDVQTAAIDSFLGDIYSGLQVAKWSTQDRTYANKHLYILSGLYGVLKALDGIYPYRLEMGYRLPEEPYANLYKFWGDDVAKTLPKDQPIINLAAVEYSKLVTPFVEESRVITPSFLTVNDKTKEPSFIVVHAKIARGAFARWLIQNKIEDPADLVKFKEIGYKYDKRLSTPALPVFVCQKFGGLGLSMRLK